MTIFTVGADGRFSKVSQLTGIKLIETAAPLEIVRFRLPLYPEEPDLRRLLLLNKLVLFRYQMNGQWDIFCFIPKGKYPQILATGIEAFQQSIVEAVPEFGDAYGGLRPRAEHLKDWKQLSFLLLQMGRVERWYGPGLLLLGDAAHVMSPIGGVGILYGIQDAVAAANILIEPLLRGDVRLNHLAAVQRQRELPIRIIQAFQSVIHEGLIAKALTSEKTYKLPAYLHLPMLPHIIGKLLAFGV